VVELNAILEPRPVAESNIVAPLPVGSVPETVKCKLCPTVASCGPGTVMIGRTVAETTVMTTND